MPRHVSGVRPVAGDIWKSKHRAGYSVLVLAVEWRTYRFGQRIQMVDYKTHTTPAKRASPIPAQTDMDNFLRTFRKTYPELENS